MKWIQRVLIFLIELMSKFTNIGRNTVNNYPKLLNLFSKMMDSDLVGFIIKANILVDRNGKKQIQLLTKNGWEIVDISFLEELESFLGSNCYIIDLDDAAEITSNFQESLNDFLKKSKEIFSSTARKNKM